MNSAVVALLWENWRLSRVEAAQRLAIGLVAASAVLALSDNGATVAFWILIAMHAFLYFSIAKLNGGRFMDGYKPGFQLHLLYTRPVPTAVFVGVGMAYDALSCTALYLVSAALLRFAFDEPLPLFSVTVLLVSYHLAYLAAQWATRNRVVQFIAAFGISAPFFLLLTERVKSSPQIEFSLAENAVMALVGVVSFGVTVAGVARQRRGDAVTSVPRAAGSAGYPEWLVGLFRFPCPTSSATRAQIWFELRSSGLPALAIGLTTAILIPLLFAISVAVMPVRNFALGGAMFSVPVLLFLLGGNAFGIRRKQGRAYASSFEATQPYGTGQLAGLKILVRSSCVLAAMIAVGVSLWASSSLVGAWGTWVDGSQEPILGLLKIRRNVGDAFGGLSSYAHVAQVVLAFVAVAIVVAGLAAREAIRARYPRRLLAVGALLLLWFLAIVLVILARRSGIASASLVDTVLWATRWIATAALVFTTIYLFWRGFAERAVTIRYICGALVISAAFGAAWVTMLHAPGEQLARTLATNGLWIVALLIPPLMASALAPWSLSRVRHM
jgi:hypothetical protein